MAKKLTLDIFLLRAKEIHGNLYDYSQVVYKNMHTKVKIIDPEFGEFWQTPMGHIQAGQGHRLRGFDKAADKRRMPTEDFIKKANEVHNNFYDYSKVDYIHCDKNVCIIDPEYGEFWQTPYNHLRNHGCPARTKDRKWLIHEDHIIPLSIICTQHKINTWVKNRPLYKFLNSPINLQKVTPRYNWQKSENITIKDKVLFAGHVRNNYEIISLLSKTLLNTNINDIIEEDKKYIQETLLNSDK